MRLHAVIPLTVPLYRGMPCSGTCPRGCAEAACTVPAPLAREDHGRGRDDAHRRPLAGPLAVVRCVLSGDTVCCRRTVDRRVPAPAVPGDAGFRQPDDPQPATPFGGGGPGRPPGIPACGPPQSGSTGAGDTATAGGWSVQLPDTAASEGDPSGGSVGGNRRLSRPRCSGRLSRWSSGLGTWQPGRCRWRSSRVWRRRRSWRCWISCGSMRRRRAFN